MAQRTRLAPALLLLAGLAVRAVAEDHVLLSDGRDLSGTIIREDATEVHLAQGTSVQVLPRTLVRQVQYGEQASTAVQATSVAPANPTSSTAAASFTAASPTTVAPAPGTYPALRPGIVLVLRTSEGLDAERDHQGRHFTAVLVESALIDGVVVLPMGTTVEAELSESKRGGRLFGRSVLEITVVAILIDGRRLPCSTDAAVARGSSATPNTLATTATGTVIGAIIDGGRGAGVGAGIGLGVSLLTRPDGVHLPIGSVLDVRITEPFQR